MRQFADVYANRYVVGVARCLEVDPQHGPLNFVLQGLGGEFEHEDVWPAGVMPHAWV